MYEDEKSARLKQQENHLALAKECRAYYKQQCEDSSNFWNSLNDEQKQSGYELAGTVHISFDYAQNVLIPHSPQQVGPIYFKTPRKCHLFGICAESMPKQVNYLIDEGELTGKGANETISYSIITLNLKMLSTVKILICIVTIVVVRTKTTPSFTIYVSEHCVA